MKRDWPIDHVHLVISDINRSLDFYRGVLGLSSKAAGDHVCLHPRDSGKCVIYLEEGKIQVDRENYIYHIALLQPDRETLGALLERILSQWDNIEGYADHIVSEAIYVRDPDYIGVELYSDRDRSLWRHDEKGFIVMDTLPLDIDDLIMSARRKRSGVEIGRGMAVGHIHLRGRDPETAGRFYIDVMGMRLTGVWFGARFLSYGGYHHHVAINSWPVPRPQDGSGLRSFAINMGSSLLRSGIGDIGGYSVSDLPCGARRVITDPNGFRIEIIEP